MNVVAKKIASIDKTFESSPQNRLSKEQGDEPEGEDFRTTQFLPKASSDTVQNLIGLKGVQ